MNINALILLVNLAAKGPTILKASGYEKGSGGTRDLPNRLEDEVFSDAAAEFLDSGFGSGTQENQVDAAKSAIDVEKIVKSESNTIQSSEGGPIAGKLSIFLQLIVS